MDWVSSGIGLARLEGSHFLRLLIVEDSEIVLTEPVDWIARSVSDDNIEDDVMSGSIGAFALFSCSRDKSSRRRRGCGLIGIDRGRSGRGRSGRLGNRGKRGSSDECGQPG
jgi:hypothetical protein